MSFKNILTLICYGISLFVYTGLLLWGLLGDHRGSYFGYGLVSFYLVIPIFSFVMALTLSISNSELKKLYPILFSVFGLAIPAIVSLSRLSSWSMFLDVWPLCVIPVFLGSYIGNFIRSMSRKA